MVNHKGMASVKNEMATLFYNEIQATCVQKWCMS